MEDEPVVAEVTREALEALGYSVEVTHGAAEALERLSRLGSAFDLVLTDERMPEMTGTEMIRELRGSHPNLPVVLCTGHYGDGSTARARDTGAEAVVFKPVKLDDLGRIVRRVLDRNHLIG